MAGSGSTNPGAKVTAQRESNNSVPPRQQNGGVLIILNYVVPVTGSGSTTPGTKVPHRERATTPCHQVNNLGDLNNTNNEFNLSLETFRGNILASEKPSLFRSSWWDLNLVGDGMVGRQLV